MTFDEMLRKGRKALAQAGVETPEKDARLLLQFSESLSEIDIILALNQTVSLDSEQRFLHAINQRSKRQPVSQIIGKRNFFGRDFQVTPAVLDPRPETEILILTALDWLRNHSTVSATPRILDLGVGSGCILLTLLAEIPQATGLGIDISDDSLKVANVNSRQLGVQSRATFTQGNWLNGIHETFDLVVSNPPYLGLHESEHLTAEVKNWEPKAALYAGKDGLEAYREIAKNLSRCLKPNGAAIFEFGIHQENAVARIMQAAKLVVKACPVDLDQRPRCILIEKEK